MNLLHKSFFGFKSRSQILPHLKSHTSEGFHNQLLKTVFFQEQIIMLVLWISCIDWYFYFKTLFCSKCANLMIQVLIYWLEHLNTTQMKTNCGVLSYCWSKAQGCIFYVHSQSILQIAVQRSSLSTRTHRIVPHAWQHKEQPETHWS